MFAVYVIAFLCLVPVSYPAPLACDDLVRPLDKLDHHHLQGRWALVAGSLNNPAEVAKFLSRDSAIINFGNASETSTILLTRVFGFDGSCQYMHSNITVEGNSFNFTDFNISVTALYTSCPDCLVMRYKNDSKKSVRFYLFSRRREVEKAEMDEFVAQAECLNMLPPVAMDPAKELCPEQISTDTEGQNA